MKDFSFFYGPIRTLATIAATVALLVVVGLRYTQSDSATTADDCPSVTAAGASGSYAAAPSVVDCPEKPVFCDETDPADCGNEDDDDEAPDGAPAARSSSGDGEPVLIEAGQQNEERSPWDDFVESGNEVPFVSIEPSERGLTEAGKELLPTTTTIRPPRAPAPAPAPAPTAAPQPTAAPAPTEAAQTTASTTTEEQPADPAPNDGDQPPAPAPGGDPGEPGDDGDG